MGRGGRPAGRHAFHPAAHPDPVQRPAPGGKVPGGFARQSAFLPEGRPGTEGSGPGIGKPAQRLVRRGLSRTPPAHLAHPSRPAGKAHRL